MGCCVCFGYTGSYPCISFDLLVVLNIYQFKKTVISVKYQNYESNEDFWHCDLWEWAADIIRNPILADKFVWDACKLSKYNGTDFIPFVHEPWTAHRFWEIQVSS